HAGGVGTVGAEGRVQDNLAYVFGTSSCTMTTTSQPVKVPGVWGPYYSAMVPGAWLNEGGQSAAGAAIDHLLTFHPAAAEARGQAEAVGQTLPEWLAAQAVETCSSPGEAAYLAGSITVVPEFLGNRAPHANPHTGAVIAGLDMTADIDSLVSLYIAGICGLGYGLRQIIEAQANCGAPVKTIVISGGAGRSDLIRQLLADATGLEVAAPETEEPVLLGAAMLGAVAGKGFPDLATAMGEMASISHRYEPCSAELRDWHDRKYRLFGKFQAVALEAAEQT
ncbi:FGGY-family carbohydrate kinase, partial [Roseibium sp.]|uniref:FGGY-family carbohydrate kinase n=1 Tax=Roseibium sp. TaxID=1936156 RepID=UPI003D0B04D1